jgi:hypothetical protein
VPYRDVLLGDIVTVAVMRGCLTVTMKQCEHHFFVAALLVAVAVAVTKKRKPPELRVSLQAPRES